MNIQWPDPSASKFLFCFTKDAKEKFKTFHFLSKASSTKKETKVVESPPKSPPPISKHEEEINKLLDSLEDTSKSATSIFDGSSSLIQQDDFDFEYESNKLDAILTDLSRSL